MTFLAWTAGISVTAIHAAAMNTIITVDTVWVIIWTCRLCACLATGSAKRIAAMPSKTEISWTEQTWNPIAGCSVVSPGCKRCYAMKMARRLELMGSATYAGLTQQSAAGPVWTGKIAVNESTMLAPLKRKKPTMYFVNSMSDLFHESVPVEVIDRVFAVMEHCRQHTYQVLTKRSDRMRAYLTARKNAAPIMVPLGNGLLEQHPFNNEMQVPPHIWLGVSVEDQKRADERIRDLLATPAAVRFLSCEPLLGPVSLEQAWHGENALESECWGDCAWCEKGLPPLHNCQWNNQSEADEAKGRSGIDWVIVGGESGPGARPMANEWAQSIVDQCKAASVPVFVKQLSSGGAKAIKDIDQFPEGLRVREWPTT